MIEQPVKVLKYTVHRVPEFLSLLRKWVPPTPTPPVSTPPPPPGSKGGATLAGEGHNSDEGADTLVLYVQHSIITLGTT
jgi:hypothetical protein